MAKLHQPLVIFPVKLLGMHGQRKSQLQVSKYSPRADHRTPVVITALL
jgi:hypothetical protein